jgi:hypothetical protein
MVGNTDRRSILKMFDRKAHVESGPLTTLVPPIGIRVHLPHASSCHCDIGHSRNEACRGQTDWCNIHGHYLSSGAGSVISDSLT